MFIPARAIVPHRPVTRPGLWSQLRSHLAAITAAHAGVARLSQVTEADIRDTRLSPAELLGQSSHHPALPFFLQPGIDRR